MLTKIAGINFSAKAVKYHYSCKRAYTNKVKRMDDTTNDDVRSGKHMFHNLAFEKLKQYIDTELVEKEGAEFLSSLHNRYKEHLNESDTSYSAQSLSLKIMKNYEGVLCLHKSTNKIGIIIHSVKLTTGQAIKRAKFDDNAIAEVVMLLRRHITYEQASGGVTWNIKCWIVTQGPGAYTWNTSPIIHCLIYRIWSAARYWENKEVSAVSFTGCYICNMW